MRNVCIANLTVSNTSHPSGVRDTATVVPTGEKSVVRMAMEGSNLQPLGRISRPFASWLVLHGGKPTFRFLTAHPEHPVNSRLTMNVPHISGTYCARNLRNRPSTESRFGCIHGRSEPFIGNGRPRATEWLEISHGAPTSGVWATAPTV